MEQTECSETSAYKIQTLKNYAEESIQHSEHGESLKSRSKSTFSLCSKQWSSTKQWKRSYAFLTSALAAGEW